MSLINVAIAGVGNCASNFIQGLEYYKRDKNCSDGLMYRMVGGYDISDIRVVAAFDISASKVGKDLSDAIFASPNCTKKIIDVPSTGVVVQKGPVLDGWAEHFKDHIVLSDDPVCNIEEVLRGSCADILVILLPTGAKLACYEYTKAALNLGISVVNGIPVLISHDPEIVELALNNHACIVGDDFKSQIGGTILHHTLLHLLQMRGIKIQESYQLNYAGNMDFYNLSTERGREKHKSKARGVSAGIKEMGSLSIDTCYLSNQKDNKTCRINIVGENFGRCPVRLDIKLNVVDSANASGVLVEAIRCIMVAKEKGIAGRLNAPSAFFMKSPYLQMTEEMAVAEIERLMEKSDL